MRKSLKQVKTELVNRPPAEEENPAPTPGPGSTPPPLSPSGNPINPETGREITRESVRCMLKAPFGIMRGFAYFNGVNGEKLRIPPILEEEIIDSGFQVCLDFGVAKFNRWVNLMQFGLMYGGCLVGAGSELIKAIKSKKIVEAKKDDSEEVGQVATSPDTED